MNIQTNNFIIHPYYLGLWLGDGDSDAVRITTMDEEIKLFIKQYTESIGLFYKETTKLGNKASRVATSGNNTSYTKKIVAYNDTEEIEFNSLKEAASFLGLTSGSSISYQLSGKYHNVKGYKFRYVETTYTNSIKRYLIDNNIFMNKHVPGYMFSYNRDYKLKLLAGIIDSDGKKFSSLRYGISFKSKFLIDSVNELCKSLDFDTRLSLKNTKLKDGRDYPYWELVVYGNEIDTIPVLLDRKKIRKYEEGE